MIVDSDNDALTALYDNDRQVFIDVLQRLRITPPPTIETEDFMSPKTYAQILRTLFSSTYLSRSASEQALQMLSYTSFKQGLVAGVPAGTIVAHKFGEHTQAINDQPLSHQLHDCGIIYYPGRPYLLCVMTRGQNFSQLENVISGISRVVYQQISSGN